MSVFTSMDMTVLLGQRLRRWCVSVFTSMDITDLLGQRLYYGGDLSVFTRQFCQDKDYGGGLCQYCDVALHNF